MVTSRYCSLLGGYWWILLVTARNCSFPLLVWMPWNSTITDKWKKNLVLLNKMGVIVWKESKTKVSERFLLINDTFVRLVHICFRVPLYKIMSSGNVLWSKPTSKNASSVWITPHGAFSKNIFPDVTCPWDTIWNMPHINYTHFQLMELLSFSQSCLRIFFFSMDLFLILWDTRVNQHMDYYFPSSIASK